MIPLIGLGIGAALGIGKSIISSPAAGKLAQGAKDLFSGKGKARRQARRAERKGKGKAKDVSKPIKTQISQSDTKAVGSVESKETGKHINAFDLWSWIQSHLVIVIIGVVAIGTILFFVFKRKKRGRR